jgi:hypothetical protein
MASQRAVSTPSGHQDRPLSGSLGLGLSGHRKPARSSTLGNHARLCDNSERPKTDWDVGLGRRAWVSLLYLIHPRVRPEPGTYGRAVIAAVAISLDENGEGLGVRLRKDRA